MLNPKWIVPIHNDSGGEDHLGLRGIQQNVVGYVLPGIITITPRARYYAFYCWVILEYYEGHPEGWSLNRFMRRREQIFGLANLAFASLSDGRMGGLTGFFAFSDHWEEYQDAEMIPLSVDSYLSRMRTGYSNYSGVMGKLHLVGSQDDSSEMYKMSPDGQQLARAFAAAVDSTAYYRDRREYDLAEQIPRRVVEEYGQHCNLDVLAEHPDRDETLEALFAFDAPSVAPPAQEPADTRGSMQYSLGMILDMCTQADGPLTDDGFRERILYGLCEDYRSYKPADALRPTLTHWRMYQLRELYSYALYSLWAYFLRWLRANDPQPLEAFLEHLAESVDLQEACARLELEMPSRPLSEWPLPTFLTDLLDASGIPDGEWQQRFRHFAARSRAPLNSQAIQRALVKMEKSDPLYPGTAWVLLCAVTFRLSGLDRDADYWYWAKEGGKRRRAVALFAAAIEKDINGGTTVLDTLTWIYRDYIINQHLVTALNKWGSRKSNTFHFVYENGLFDWVKNDSPTYTASRFDYAHQMLSDLGLIVASSENGENRVTPLGKETLDRVLGKYGV